MRLDKAKVVSPFVDAAVRRRQCKPTDLDAAAHKKPVRILARSKLG